MPIRPVRGRPDDKSRPNDKGRPDNPGRPIDPGRPDNTGKPSSPQDRLEKRLEMAKEKATKDLGYEIRNNTPMKVTKDSLGRIKKEEPLTGDELRYYNAAVNFSKRYANRRR